MNLFQCAQVKSIETGQFARVQLTKTDCRYYRGAIPCLHHKRHGIHCADCANYEKLAERFLIIKLGAVGDVIRTTPLLRKLKSDFPNAEITWITYSVEVIPLGWVDNILEFSFTNVLWLEQQHFDWLINLDKDREAIALAERITATKKSGFRMNQYGKCIPMGHPSEEHKWLTGVWDDLNQANTMNYMEEIFLICGYTFNGEEYILDVENQLASQTKDVSKIVVGLNTGCGARWTTRLWPDDRWAELATALMTLGYDTVLLGGPQEDEKNKRLAQLSGADYFGTTSLHQFFSLINKCDVIVSQVTMAMHVAIALKRYLVLLNNIFNRNEFYLYDRGVIIQPDLDCLGCFKQTFDQNCKSTNCMEMIGVSDVITCIRSRFP